MTLSAMGRRILPVLSFFFNIGFAVAAATPEEAAKIENLFAQLEQQPGVKPENVAALEKAKPLVNGSTTQAECQRNGKTNPGAASWY